MENTVKNLDIIIQKVSKLMDAYHDLKAENETMRDQISLLKVEVENYKSQIEQNNNINIATPGKVEDQKVAKQLTNQISDISEVRSASPHQGQQQPELLKMQLDEIIDELDQCIHIIQKNRDGKQ
ncbi:MAG: hypothetical protein J5I52_08290 [Saprospiraceae bacterium]|nr:MAG: hypothetical protein UZ09_BCD002000847 [Bacteroidetes bacterium OLB9]MCO6464133.1 hypothetical protein [Saprospiraceae bacterium]MCZ2338965.1 hypothetical protein [Chitinophagales bacterium]